MTSNWIGNLSQFHAHVWFLCLCNLALFSIQVSDPLLPRDK